MEVDNLPLSSPAGHTYDPSSTPTEARKSRRTTRRPDVFSQSTHSIIESASGKRKWDDTRDHDDDGDEDEDASESESDDAGDDDADEEELREKQRAARKARAKKPSNPKGKRSHAAKKPKVGNGIKKKLAFRPAANGRLPTSRPKKPKVRPSLAAGERGLFGM